MGTVSSFIDGFEIDLFLISFSMQSLVYNVFNVQMSNCCFSSGLIHPFPISVKGFLNMFLGSSSFGNFTTSYSKQ